MATFIVSFENEEQAQEAIARLSGAGLGEVRARVLDSAEDMSYPKTEDNAPMITPGLGSVEVRPEVTPKMPEAMHDNEGPEASAAIPTTGKTEEGIQVMVEVDDLHVETVRRILGMSGKTGRQ